ncbi:MAG: hypothetical protein ACLFUU_13105, partial [Desulfobacteraceae bacterium]
MYPDQLNQLIQLCDDYFEKDPITFYVLIIIFENILNVFWESEQVLPENYHRLESKLSPLILAVWESSGEQRKLALERLIIEFKDFRLG